MTQPDVGRIEMLLEIGRPAEALEQLALALGAHPQDARLLGLLALAHYRNGAYDRALEAAQARIAVDPEGEFGYRLSGLSLVRLGQHQRAISAIERATSLAPHDWLTHFAAASVLAATHGRIEDAWREVTRALQLQPADPDLQVLAGTIAEERHDFESGRAHYERALSLQPNHALALNNLANFTPPVKLSVAGQAYAAALRADPQLKVAQRNLDRVLSRMAGYLNVVALFGLVVGAWLDSSGEDPPTTSPALGHPNGNSFVLVFAILVLPGLFMYRVLSSFPRSARSYARSTLHRKPLLLVRLGLTAVMAALAVVAFTVPWGAGIAARSLPMFLLLNLALIVVARVSKRRAAKLMRSR